LLKWGDRLPRRANPPVVFVTGHDAVCPDPRSGETPFFNLTFGKFDQVMARSGRVSLVFEACYIANRPRIEELARLFGDLISWLTYEDGQPVSEVDVVAHSMGGLVIRAYLAGKQSSPGLFSPPTVTRLRKVVFIGTPHFGTTVASPHEADPQLQEMSVGSSFLFELATWNQGRDDLRGVHALSIVGTAGNNSEAGFSDSVVVLTSASLGFVAQDHTVVLPFCHTYGGIGSLLLCSGAIGIAKVDDEQHPTARIVLSFLNGGAEWQLSGEPAARNRILSTSAAILGQLRTADDASAAITTAHLKLRDGSELPLSISAAGLAYAEKVPAGPMQLNLNGYGRDIDLRPGGGHAVIAKPGPLITTVEPAPGATWPLVLAPGMRVAIRGSRLNDGDLEVTTKGVALNVMSRDNEEVVVVLPEQIVGLVDLTVKNISGRHTTRIYLEPAVPVLFSEQPPAEAGEIASLFLTGLGNTANRDGLSIAMDTPSVTVAGEPCAIEYAGRAPDMPGIDQINCRIPPSARGWSTVVVTSKGRSSSGVVSVR
jgi:uncharacterized protein (TIGR03437 family)